MRKIHVLLLSVCMMLCVFSCSQPDEEIVPEYDPEVTSDVYDLNGYNYIMVGYAHGGAQGVFSLNPAPIESLHGDQLLQRYRDTEEKYNIKITHINGVDKSRFMTLYVANIKYCDLFYTVVNDFMVGGYAKNGYLHAFSDMNIDLHSGIYGTEGMLEAGRLGDDYYAIRPYYWGIPAADYCAAIWFKPSTLSLFQQPSPHELDEQGEWTWDAFEKILEGSRDTSDPDPDRHTYGCAYSNEPFLETAVIFSNNGKWVDRDANGKLVYALNRPEAIEAMDFIRSLVERDLLVDGGDRFNLVPFIENRALFFVGYTHWGLSSEGSENLSYKAGGPFEWTYFPLGPRADKNTPKGIYSYWSRFFFVPSNTDISIHELLLPYMLQPLPGDTAENWQDSFERNNFFSSRSFELFSEIRDTAVFDYSTFCSYQDTFKPLLLSITRGQKSAAEGMEAISSKVQEYIDANYNDYVFK